jgi:hypothetical protein
MQGSFPEWLNDIVSFIVTALVGWATWITVHMFKLDKAKLSREEHDRICERHHEENIERMSRIEKKQDDLMTLIIDVIRKD